MPDSMDFRTYHMLFRIVSAIVGEPDQVTITTTRTEDGLRFRVSGDSENIAQIVGSEGQVLRSLQTVFSGISRKRGKRLLLTIQKDEADKRCNTLSQTSKHQ